MGIVMTDLNNTASTAALVAGNVTSLVASKPHGSLVSTVAEGEALSMKKRSLSQIVLRDALAAVTKNLETNFALVTSVVAMTVDALARNVADKLPLGNDPKPDARRQVPSMVSSTHSKVLRELKINMTLVGRSPFSNAAEGVAFVLALPRNTQQQKNIRRAQAEKLVDASLFHNGFPVGPFKKNLVPAEYAGAEPKANIESLKLANKYSGFIVDWFWNNNAELIRNFATRVPADYDTSSDKPAGFVDLNSDDLVAIRNVIRSQFGDTMTELEESYRAGRPVRESKSRIDTLKNTFVKLSHAEMVEFLQFAQGKAAELARGEKNVKAAVGTDADDEIDDILMEGAGISSADAEHTADMPMTGTNG